MGLFILRIKETHEEIKLDTINIITFDNEESGSTSKKVELKFPLNSLDTPNAVGSFRAFDGYIDMKKAMAASVSNSYSI